MCFASIDFLATTVPLLRSRGTESLERGLVDTRYLRGDGEMHRGDGKAIAVLVDDDFRFAVDLLRHEVRMPSSLTNDMVKQAA